MADEIYDYICKHVDYYIEATFIPDGKRYTIYAVEHFNFGTGWLMIDKGHTFLFTFGHDRFKDLVATTERWNQSETSLDHTTVANMIYDINCNEKEVFGNES